MDCGIISVETHRDNALRCAVGVPCLAVIGVPKSMLPIFTESGRRLREEFSDRRRDHGGLCYDVLSWAICEFSTGSLGRLDVLVIVLEYSIIPGYPVPPWSLESAPSSQRNIGDILHHTIPLGEVWHFFVPKQWALEGCWRNRFGEYLEVLR